MPSGLDTLRRLRVTVVRGGGGGMISESSSEDDVTAGWATSDTEEYGTVAVAVGVVAVAVVVAVAASAASCSWVARKANASSPAELERGRRALEELLAPVLLVLGLVVVPVKVTEPSFRLSPERWLLLLLLLLTTRMSEP